MTLTDIRIRELATSVESYRMLLAQKQKELDQARVQVVRIGQELCGAAFADLMQLSEKNPVAVEILATFIINMVKSQPAATVNSGLVPDISAELDDLRTQLDTQTRRAARAEDQVKTLNVQIQSYEASLADARQKIQEKQPLASPPEPGLDFSAWFEGWSKSDNFERESRIVMHIGSTGHARKSELQQELEGQFDLKRRSIYILLNECEHSGLLQSEKGASTQGRPADLLFLSPLGEWIYTRLTNRPPQKSELFTLLKAHKSSHHVAAILTTADHFTRLGFEVERQPAQLKIADNRFYQPDLIAAQNRDTFYIEVETGERYDRASLPQKWANAATAGGGKICLVTPNPSLMNTFQSSIVAWATDRHQQIMLYLSNLEALRKTEKGASPWARIRPA